MRIRSIVFICFSFLILNCNGKEATADSKETMLEGKTSVLVDETLKPIIEDQIAVFENEYPAKITLIPRSEKQALQALFKDSARIVILTRDLSAEEKKFFEQKKIIPKTTPFATDAIALITNKANKDTLIALDDVKQFMQGKAVKNIKGMVFDNPNSSTVRYMTEFAGVSNIPEKGVFSFNTNKEVIKFVSENEGMIGVIGVNWLSQPSPGMESYIDKVTTLSVKNATDNQYYAPTQNSIAEKKYPLARDLYIVNCQGFAGLGKGFSVFIAGERGQRIILKSGLLPYQMPGRKIKIK